MRRPLPPAVWTTAHMPRRISARAPGSSFKSTASLRARAESSASSVGRIITPFRASVAAALAICRGVV